jgi:hypothetical protein
LPSNPYDKILQFLFTQLLLGQKYFAFKVPFIQAAATEKENGEITDSGYILHMSKYNASENIRDAKQLTRLIRHRDTGFLDFVHRPDFS